MDYLLDSNACIIYLNGRSSKLKQRLESHRPENIYVCSVVKAELYYGAMRTRNPTETLQVQKRFLNNFSSLSFNDDAAEYYGKIRATLAAKGQLIGPNDLLIAAIALANPVTLVTHNTREFSRVKGLLIEDWQSSDVDRD
jgi:tRNA(fMet)-specific endonuclease VapC